MTLGIKLKDFSRGRMPFLIKLQLVQSKKQASLLENTQERLKCLHESAYKGLSYLVHA